MTTTPHSPYHMAIADSLTALSEVLASAKQDVDQSLRDLDAVRQNAAIGALLPVEGALARAARLYGTVIELHRMAPEGP